MLALSLSCLLSLPACDGTPTWVLDGGPLPDGSPPRPDVGPYPDGSPSIFAEVSLSGCAEVSLTDEAQHCVGRAPLEVRFSALVPSDAASFIWDFGDGSAPSSSPSPVHLFERKGAYQVVLVVGGPFGAISPSRLLQVTVTGAQVGAYCDQDDQCSSGHCLCAEPEDGCPGALTGTCSGPCEDCAPPSLCADLGVEDASDLPEWRGRHCLPSCTSSTDCPRDGFGCREVPTFDPEAPRGWFGACLPDLLSEVGEGCADSIGLLLPARCLSGRCIEAGRFGLCTDWCAEGSCPSHAACASFSGGPLAGVALCLSRCSQLRTCEGDPDLGCEAPDPSGDWGFTLLSAGEPAGATYCAPRRCTEAIHCPSGTCNLDGGGFCQGPL
ncbi:MAG: PKD domain-containing protein [Polyangia bacterium]|jgi:hypothetical protein|nr:PKD domain-containing protein [Polyangia bacterium]